ncbi:hypothetical protein C8R45DRAFT_994292 [Mycena sanguinolenta]|nr:hypothetical protein C8R45DRAFT_994292 [Mycena sanguinolenta]
MSCARTSSVAPMSPGGVAASWAPAVFSASVSFSTSGTTLELGSWPSGPAAATIAARVGVTATITSSSVWKAVYSVRGTTEVLGTVDRAATSALLGWDGVGLAAAKRPRERTAKVEVNFIFEMEKWMSRRIAQVGAEIFGHWMPVFIRIGMLLRRSSQQSWSPARGTPFTGGKDGCCGVRVKANRLGEGVFCACRGQEIDYVEIQWVKLL